MAHRGVATFVAGFHAAEAVAAMPYRAFGASGRVVSVLSAGASSMGGGYSAAPVDEDEAAAVMVEAVRSGVNLIDTAPWYGHGKANVVLAKALRRIPRAAYYLQTKVGRYHPDVLRQFDFSYRRTLASIDESLEVLGVDYLDTVLVHDPEFAPSLDVIVSDTLPAIADAVRAGKVKGIGITGYPLDVLQTLAARTPVPITTAISYSHYTLHDQSLVTSGALAALQARGIGVINAAPLSMGLLTASPPPVWHPAAPALRARCADAAAYCASRGVDLSRLALAFALANPAISTTMASTPRLTEMRANLALATGAAPLSPAERAVLDTLRATTFSAAAQGATASWEGVEVDKYWRKVRAAAAAAAAAASAAAAPPCSRAAMACAPPPAAATLR